MTRESTVAALVAAVATACVGNLTGSDPSKADISQMYEQCVCDEDEVPIPTVCPTPAGALVPTSGESALYAKLTRSYKPGKGHWASSHSPPPGYSPEASWYLLRDGDCETQQLLWECSFLGRTNYLSHTDACIGSMSQRAVGFVYRRPASGAVALYQCLIETSSDFFVSDRADCEGHQRLGLIGYALPSPVDPPPAATEGTSCECPDPEAPDGGPGDPDAGPGDPDAGPGDPDASPGDPDAAPGAPDAAPGAPDAAPGAPDAAPGNPDAGGPIGDCPPEEDNGPLIGLPYPAVDAEGVKGIVYAPGEPSTRIPLLEAAGTRVVGYNIPWYVVEPDRDAAPCGSGEFEYDGYCYRDVVGSQIKSLNDAGIRVTAVLYGVPEWARVGNTNCSPLNATFAMFCAPDNPDDFARFAGMLAQRYDGQGGRGRIHNFVIHNEVNSNIWFDIGCGSGTSCNTDAWIAEYADNYNLAYDRIKMHQSEARVLVSLEHVFGPSGQNLSTDYPLIAGSNFLLRFADFVGDRNWQLAMHPYPPNLLIPEFSVLDWPYITYGNPGQIVGWLRQNFPDDPHAWKVQFTESGINSSSPNSSEAAQATGVCASNYNVVATPWVTDYIYHGMFDDGLSSELQVGLFRADGSAKPAWGVWANQNDCGYQYLPYTRLARSYKGGAGHWASSRTPPAGYAEESAWYLDRNGDCTTQQLLWECNVSNHTTYLSDSPTCAGATNMGPVGYAHLSHQSGTVGLYQCKVSDSDWFVSPDSGCEGQSYVGFLGYVRTSP